MIKPNPNPTLFLDILSLKNKSKTSPDNVNNRVKL